MVSTRSEPVEGRAVVVAADSRVKSHHQTVLGGHACHFEGHMVTKSYRIGQLDGASKCSCITSFGAKGVKWLGPHVRMAVVG